MTTFLQHSFPNVKQPALAIPINLHYNKDECAILELRNDGHAFLSLQVAQPIQSLQVHHEYREEEIQTFYLIIDNMNVLHIAMSHQQGLKVCTSIPGIALAKTGDFKGVGHPQVHLQRTDSDAWEAFNLDDFTFHFSKQKESLPPKQILTPLSNGLDGCNAKLKNLSGLLLKKQLLRAKVVNGMDPENNKIHHHVKILYCKYFFLHGRLIQAVKIKSRVKLDQLKIVAITSANVNIKNPGGVHLLAEDSLKILLAVIDHSSNLTDICTLLEYKVTDTLHYVPLPPPYLKTVINNNQNLRFLSAEDCLEILTLASSKISSICWTNAEKLSWDEIKAPLGLLKMSTSLSKTIEVSSFVTPELSGAFLLAELHKKRAVMCFRDYLQLEIVQRLLRLFDISFNEKSKNHIRVPGETGVSVDLKLIKQKGMTKDYVSRRKYQQTLQDLIHEIDAFAS